MRMKEWAIWELQIQQKAKNKDGHFLASLAKFLEIRKVLAFIREQDGFEIYRVDTEFIRNNLIADFEHAGHGFVHLLIPMNHIWIGAQHFNGCACKNVREDRRISEKNFESSVIHEITEFKLMEKGMPYGEAHQIALGAERKAGILKDPYIEEYD
ncbi:MAG: hypothetical protein HYV47_04180 [Candidatus Nealsonbacteria bacterium]|nr:hypothetical protein [Candidatus Nealsonbacteria bacterium]